MSELLRPPAHRGPLIAAGAVVLTVGVVLQQLRLGDELDVGWHTLISGTLAALLLWLGAQASSEGGRPRAHQSVLLVCGLALSYLALLRLADVLGADFDTEFPAGAFVWTSVVQALGAVFLASRRDSAIAAFIAAVAFAIAVLSAWDWIFDPESVTPFRWLLLLIALTYVVVGLILRAPRPRHSELVIVAAGLSTLTIAVVELFTALFGVFQEFGPPELLPGFWEAVLLGAGFGLVAYAAADRSPGPAWLGAANLGAFVVIVTLSAEDTLEWWPLTLLLIGALMLLAGLRPRKPLPPEPAAYRAGDVPLAARTEGDETVFEVRD